MIVQELARMITGSAIYERQAVGILVRAEKNAVLLRKLDRIDPQWVHNYCAAQEWYIHKEYSHWQMTAPKHRWKPFACVVLKMEKKDVTAQAMWDALKEIAKHYKTGMDNIIKEVMTYANVIDQLASLGDE